MRIYGELRKGHRSEVIRGGQIVLGMSKKELQLFTDRLVVGTEGSQDS